MSLLWHDDIPKKGKRGIFNPRPAVPKTGWKFVNEFPSLRSANAICVDVETYDPHIKEFGAGWGRGVGYIIGVAVGTDNGFKRYFPIRHEDGPNCDPQHVLGWLNDELGREHQPKIGHNFLYDLGWLAHEGVDIKGDIHCSWTAERLLDRSLPSSLEACGQRRLKEGKDSKELYEWCWQYWGKGKPTSDKALRDMAMTHLRQVPPSMLGPYAESDVTLPLAIAVQQFEEIKELGMWEVYRMECDLLPLLVQMRLAGVSVDVDAAEQAYDKIEKEIVVLQKQLDGIAGKPVNAGSPTDMQPVFDDLHIEYPTTEKTAKIQLKKEFLETVAHPIGQLVVDIQELKKMNSTFIRGYILESNINGKIYGTIKPMEAITGRMAAETPNLQNIPSRTSLGKATRKIFVPDAGHHHWRKYDYKGIETRGLAHDAVGVGAKALRKEYRENPMADYHDFVQDMIKRVVGIVMDRSYVKTINFGILYGMMVKLLAVKLKVAESEAKELFDAYHTGLPYVRSTMDHFSTIASETGEIRTILGRRTIFDKFEPRYTKRGCEKPAALDFNTAVRVYGPDVVRAFTYKALNYRIQGNAAEVMKMGMVKCWKAGVFDRTGVPRLVVHDELDLSVPEEWDEDAFREMKHIMETSIKLKVALIVEGEWGPSWGELYKL